VVFGTEPVSGPLNGVRIVMMGGLGPAPFCGMLLGDLGADVIRVDPLAGVDGPLPIDYTVRRSQRSLAADVKDPRGRDLVFRLGPKPTPSSTCTAQAWPSGWALAPMRCKTIIRVLYTPA
jgi:hypothetical protein